MTKIIAKTLKKTCSLVGPAVETCKHLVVRNSFYCDSESQLIEMRLALQAQLDGGACSNGELLPQAESKHYHPNHCSQPEIQSLSPTCVCFCILNPEGSVSQDHNSNTKSQQKKHLHQERKDVNLNCYRTLRIREEATSSQQFSASQDLSLIIHRYPLPIMFSR